MSGGPVDDDAVTTLTTAVRELSSSAPTRPRTWPSESPDCCPTRWAPYHPADRRRRVPRPDPPRPRGARPGRHHPAGRPRATAGGIPAPGGRRDPPGRRRRRRRDDTPPAGTGPSRAAARLARAAAEDQGDGPRVPRRHHRCRADRPWLVEASYRSHDPAVVVSAMVFQSQTSFYRGRLARALELAEEATRRAGTQSAALYLRPRASRRCGWPPC